jgi:lysophospholipase L1-like esterase
LAARGFGPGGDVPIVSGSFVVSGGTANPIATITTTSRHGLIPGNYVQIWSAGDLTYHDALNGAVVKVLTTPNETRFTVAARVGGSVMPNGDYSASYGGAGWHVKSMFQFLDESWLTWLNVYMNGYFTVVANYAQGGTRSSVGVTLIPKIKAGPAADYAFIQYCTNDLNSVTPDVSGCLSNIQTIVTAVLQMGMVPIVCIPLAIGDPGAQPVDPASDVKTNALLEVRAALLQLEAQDSRVLVLDTYAASVNPQDPLGRFQPNYAPVDGVHPSSFGGARIAQVIARYLHQFLPPPDTLPTSIEDDATLNPTASDIIQNGLMTGAGGSIGVSTYNQLSGTVPTGWGVSGYGGTALEPLSITLSGNNTYANFPGYTLDLSINSASANQQFQIGTNGSGGSSFGIRMQANQWYRCGFQAFAESATSDITNLSGQVFLNFGGGNTPSVYIMASQGSLYENGMSLLASSRVTFESQPFFVPAPPSAGAWLFINGLFIGPAANQRLSFGRAFCNIVPNPYQ